MALLRRGFKTWCENAAANYRRDLGLARDAPLDPVLLARHLGILVWSPQDIPGVGKDVLKHLTVDDPDSWDAVTIAAEGMVLVILNSISDAGRRNNSRARARAYHP